MRITTIGKHDRSHQTTIPREIMQALDVSAGDYIAWTWNTKGHAEIHRVGRPGELAPRRPRRR